MERDKYFLIDNIVKCINIKHCNSLFFNQFQNIYTEWGLYIKSTHIDTEMTRNNILIL